jgi:hypothetical protein
MSHSVLQDIGLAMLANVQNDPGTNGKIYVNDAGITVVKLTATSISGRVIQPGSHLGQILVIVNTMAGAPGVITDTGGTLQLELAIGECAICVYSGVSTIPWQCVILKTGSVT